MDRSLDEEYQDVEREFWGKAPEARDRERKGASSQFGLVYEHLIPKIHKSAREDSLSSIEYQLRLDEAWAIIRDISYALSASWEDSKHGWIWFKPTLDDLKFRPESWRDASPVDKSQLDTATARYLERRWMQLNLLDWYILNGYIFDELARLAEGIKSGRAIGIINWAYLFSGGDFEKTYYWRAALEISKFVARWVLVPAIIAAVYYLGYQDIAKWIAIPYGIYILIHIVLFPFRFLRRKTLRKDVEKMQKNLEALIGVFQSSSVEVFNPSRLRDLIAKVESDTVFFSSPLTKGVIVGAHSRGRNVAANPS